MAALGAMSDLFNAHQNMSQELESLSTEWFGLDAKCSNMSSILQNRLRSSLMSDTLTDLRRTALGMEGPRHLLPTFGDFSLRIAYTPRVVRI